MNTLMEIMENNELGTLIRKMVDNKNVNAILKLIMSAVPGHSLTCIQDYYLGSDKLLTKGDLYTITSYSIDKGTGLPSYVIRNDRGISQTITLHNNYLKVIQWNWEDAEKVSEESDSELIKVRGTDLLHGKYEGICNILNGKFIQFSQIAYKIDVC